MSEKITFTAAPSSPEGLKLELNNPNSASTPIGRARSTETAPDAVDDSLPVSEITSPTGYDETDSPTEAGQDEARRIYEDPTQDPAFVAAEALAKKIHEENFEEGYRILQRATNAKELDALHEGEWKAHFKKGSEQVMAVWDKFVSEYPEKAAIYQAADESLRHALERRDKAEVPSEDATPKTASEASTPQESEKYRKAEFDVKPLVAESASLPEMPDFSQPQERDWRRIEREAKEYFDEFEDPKDIVALRGELARHLMEVGDATMKLLSERGLTSQPGEDLYKQQVANKRVLETIAKAREAAKPKKIAELVSGAFNYENDSRKERKEVARLRENLTKILNMPPEQYDQLMRDWQHHNMRELHAEALEEDKKYKVGKEQKKAKKEIVDLDEKYGGALGEISQLPIDKEPGGATDKVLEAYLQAQKKEDERSDGLVDKTVIGEALLASTVEELEGQLKQKYRAEGLSEDQIQAKLAESSPVLETWLRHMQPDSEHNVLDELQEYGRQKNKEQLYAGKRQKAAEYIGSMLFMRALKGVLNREKPAETADTQPEINVSEILEHGVDHSASRFQGGGEVLSNPERAESFRGRVMAQLEMARALSRNENTLMKALVYYTAVEKSLGNGFVSAWEAIPEEKKKQARKKLMLGMAATSAAIARMSAKAVAKAKTAAATGAAAGTIWVGNKLKR